MVNFVLVLVHLCVNQLLSKVLTSLACFKVPRGKNQGLELSCLLIGDTMGQEADETLRDTHRGAASMQTCRTVRTGPNLNSTQNGDPID